MADIQVFIGKHRTLALAERHRKELERKNPGYDFFITSRRNDKGKISSRGKTFTFEPRKQAKEIKSLSEFIREYDDADEYDVVEIEGGVDYGEE